MIPGGRKTGDFREAEPRSIPAWAGKPNHLVGSACLRRGPVLSFVFRSLVGLSPRGRGTRQLALRHPYATCTSVPVYPRVGGETLRDPVPSRQRLSGETNNLYPFAWAGKPELDRMTRCREPVYPRVGGASGIFDARYLRSGLSPRGRGNQETAPALLADSEQSRHRRPASGSIPAWAGKPQAGLLTRLPHGQALRSIPAWAGKPNPTASSERRVDRRRFSFQERQTR